MAWEGFTDEQLRRLKDDDSEEGFTQSNPSRKPAQRDRGGAHRGRGNAQRGRGGRNNRTAAQRASGPRPPLGQHAESLSPNQMLSKPKEVLNRTRPGQRPKPEVSDQDNLERTGGQAQGGNNERSGPRAMIEKSSSQVKGDGVDETKKKDGLVNALVDDNEEVENREVITEEIDEKEGRSRELTKLQKFQEEQSKMEEDNARRKTLLSKALADRKRKTQAETKRLAYIQKEMGKIENLLTKDVRILRDKIEISSRDYLEAQKRYDKAEAEFVEAKVYLHKMEEMKDALTEHLFTIIHENELRKSKKLEELVVKLDIENLDEFEKQIAEESALLKSLTSTSNPDPATTVIPTAAPITSNPNDPPVVIATDTATESKSNKEIKSNGKVPLESKQSETSIVTSDECKSEQISSIQAIDPHGDQNSTDQTRSVPAGETAGLLPSKTESDSGQKSETAGLLPSKTESDSGQKAEGYVIVLPSANEPLIAS